MGAAAAAVRVTAFLIIAGGSHAQVNTLKDADKIDRVAYEIESVHGGSVDLPCNVTPTLPNDKMLIVIWFKENAENDSVPIYTFDSRESQTEKGKHWADEHIFNGRAHFWHEGELAKLTLKNVKESDSGRYSCRVDFKQSPTRSVLVNLVIILPAEKLSILDENGLHIPNYILGPYNEGTSINVTCVATGGRPPPKVTWWENNILQDDSYELLEGKRVRNVLHIAKLERKHLHNILTCQASNNELLEPITSSITLDVNLKPLLVQLSGQNRPLSANHTYELTCEVIGARPPPTITWWKGSLQMKNSRETTNADQNVTTSFLTFTPTVEDSGKYLSCRGQQPVIPQSGIEDGWKLNIYHKPIVSLELGNTLNGSVIREGVDVYFECNIKSNPWVYRVTWKHNGKVLYNNVQANVLVSNQSLVLQSVTRTREGNYVCIGHNAEGDGISNTAYLDVKYEPICRPGQPKSYGVARNEMVRILCEIEANPPPSRFRWRFTDAGGATRDMSTTRFHSEGARSTLGYKPLAESDYGTATCWAENAIGVQKEPCVFYVHPAGKPDDLTNCTIANQTSDWLHVECAEGFDGGLRQEFVMEVFDAETAQLVSNASSQSAPTFAVTGLAPGMRFDIALYAANRKGRSRAVHLHAYTVTTIEKRIAAIPFVAQMTPLLATIVGVTVAMIAIVLAVMVLRRRDGDEPTPCDTSKDVYGVKDICSSVDSLADSNPDVVPAPQDSDAAGFGASFRSPLPYAAATLRKHDEQHMPPLTVIFSQEATIYTMLDSKDSAEGRGTPVPLKPILVQTRAIKHPNEGMIPPYPPNNIRKTSLPDQNHLLSPGSYVYRHQ